MRKNGNMVMSNASLPEAKYLPYLKDKNISLGFKANYTGIEDDIKAKYINNIGYGARIWGNIYDRGDYYEVTNVSLYTAYIYDTEPTDYMIKQASLNDDWDYIGSTQVDSGKWVIGDIDGTYGYVFYTGSIYVRKDAIILCGRETETGEYKREFCALKDVFEELSEDGVLIAYIAELDENGYVTVLSKQEWG